MKTKVIFDANIWVSYFITNKHNDFKALADGNKLIVYRDNYLTAELEDVMSRSKLKNIYVILLNIILIFITD